MADVVRKVFISSTSRDLGKYRAKVKDAILRAGAYPIAMEEFDATRRNALQLCYDEMQKADVFVGIYAYRYGFAPNIDSTYTAINGEEKSGDGETGITHLEYLWAIERGLPLLLYVVSDRDEESEVLAWPHSQIEDDPGKSRMAAFKSLIMSKHVVGFFYSPDHLASQVSSALHKILAEQPNTKTLFETTRHDFYKHIPLPEHFVPRDDLMAELRLSLLSDSSSVALTAEKGKPTALHGMGGIGKSVTARALCDLPEVQAAFPDGILWTVLGQNVSNEELRGKLGDWVTTVGGQIMENVPTLEKLKSTLIEQLEKKAYLLIVDDVWQRKHAEWFKVGGQLCRMLITTRDTEVAKALGAEVQTIPLMAMHEAVALLEHWSDGHLPPYPEEIKERVAHKLGRLPLALKLAGAQLQYEVPDVWLKTFDARMLEMGRVEDIHDSLALTFQLSLNHLKPTTRQVYATLCIFKEDEPIHEAAISRLWEKLADWNEKLTEHELHDLAAQALLDLVHREYPHAVVLHDLLRDLMTVELSNQGVKAIDLHRSLLDAYRSIRKGPEWYTVPKDGYIYEHLTYHLLEADNYNDINELGYQLDKFPQPTFGSLLTHDLAHYYSQHAIDLKPILWNWLNNKNINTLAPQIVAGVAVECEIEDILKTLLIYPSEKIQFFVVQTSYRIWQTNPELIKRLLNHLSSQITIFNIQRSIKAANTLLRCSLFIGLNDQVSPTPNPETPLTLLNIWRSIFNKYFLVSDIPFVEPAMKWIRAKAVNVSVYFLMNSLRNMFVATKQSIFSFPDIENFFPASPENIAIIHRLLPHYDAAADKAPESLEELTAYVETIVYQGNNECITAYIAMGALMVHTFRDPLKSTILMSNLLEKLDKLFPPTKDVSKFTATVWYLAIGLTFSNIRLKDMSRQDAYKILNILLDRRFIFEQLYFTGFQFKSGANFRGNSCVDALWGYEFDVLTLGYEKMKRYLNLLIERNDFEQINNSIYALIEGIDYYSLPAAAFKALPDALHILIPYLEGLDTERRQMFWRNFTETLTIYGARYKDYLDSFVTKYGEELLPKEVTTQLLNVVPSEDFNRIFSVVIILFVRKVLEDSNSPMRELIKWGISQTLEASSLQNLIVIWISRLSNIVYGKTIIGGID